MIYICKKCNKHWNSQNNICTNCNNVANPMATYATSKQKIIEFIVETLALKILKEENLDNETLGIIEE